MSKNQQNYIPWDLLNNRRVIRMYENEYENDKAASTAVTFTNMPYRHIFESTLSDKSPDLSERNLQKSFIDALTTVAAENEGVKINKKLHEGDIFADIQWHLAYERDGCLSSKSKNVMLTNGQVSRNSDALSLKCGEMTRVMKLLKTRVGSANSTTCPRYEDMILRIQTGLGLIK